MLGYVNSSLTPVAVGLGEVRSGQLPPGTGRKGPPHCERNQFFVVAVLTVNDVFANIRINRPLYIGTRCLVSCHHVMIGVLIFASLCVIMVSNVNSKAQFAANDKIM